LRNEEVAACVVAEVSETDLLQFCRGALSSWQVPKRIFIMDSIPANERGKISRRELSQRFSMSRQRHRCHDWFLDKAFTWDLLRTTGVLCGNHPATPNQ
jgi:Acyl-CoA synthetases (AMP-forming)/AMP-acid ligases II